MIVCASRRFRCDLRVRSEKQGGESRVRSRSQVLRELLENPGIVRGPCCHDALSAKLIEQAGFEFAFMSGFCTSAARLGAPDVALISYYEMLDQGRAIHEATKFLPIIGDGDTGWGNALNVRRTVQGYASAGFAGILIEDQLHPKSCGHVQNKVVVDRKEAGIRIRAACDARDEGKDIVVVARSDARQAVSLYEALYRAELFAAEGADVLFIDALQSVEELREFAKIPQLRDIPKMANMLEGGKTPIIAEQELQDMGFKLVSYPLSLLSSSIKAMQISLQHLKNGQIPPDDHLLSFSQLKSVIGFDESFEFVNKYNVEEVKEIKSNPEPAIQAQKQAEHKKEEHQQQKQQSQATTDKKTSKPIAQKTMSKSVGDIKKEAKSLFEMPKSVRDSIPQQFGIGDLKKKNEKSDSQQKQQQTAPAPGFSNVQQFGGTEAQQKEEEQIRNRIITSQKSMFSSIDKPKQNKDVLANIGKSSGQSHSSSSPPTPTLTPPNKPQAPPKVAAAAAASEAASSNRQSMYTIKKPSVVQRWGGAKPIEEIQKSGQEPAAGIKPKPFITAKDNSSKKPKFTAKSSADEQGKNAAATDNKSIFFSKEEMRKIFQTSDPTKKVSKDAEKQKFVSSQKKNDQVQDKNGKTSVQQTFSEQQLKEPVKSVNNGAQQSNNNGSGNAVEQAENFSQANDVSNKQNETEADQIIQQEIKQRQNEADKNNQQETEAGKKFPLEKNEVVNEQKEEKEKIQKNEQNQIEQSIKTENIAEVDQVVAEKVNEFKNEAVEQNKKVTEQQVKAEEKQMKKVNNLNSSRVGSNGHQPAKSKFDLSQFARKNVQSEEASKEFRVYASIIEDEVPSQHYRSRRTPKREVKAQAAATSAPSSTTTLPKDEVKTQKEDKSDQESAPPSLYTVSSKNEKVPELQETREIQQEEKQVNLNGQTDTANLNGQINAAASAAVYPDTHTSPSPQNHNHVNGNGISSSSVIEEGEGEEEEEAPWVSQSGLPVVEADAILQPTGLEGDEKKETEQTLRNNLSLKIKITEAQSEKVKLETTVPAAYVKQISSWIPEIQGVDLEEVMELTTGLHFESQSPVSEFKSEKGDLVQIWVEEDQK